MGRRREAQLSGGQSDQRVCERCGEPIVNPRNKRFCGRACTGAWLGSTYPGTVTRHPTMSTCDWCGTEFYRPSKAVRFCGVPCAARWRGTQQRKLDDRPCEWCGETFTPPRATSRFCTGSCRGSWVNATRAKPEKKPSHRRETATGGLPVAQFRLWQALGDAWLPELWVSPLGVLGPEHVCFTIDLARPDLRLAVEVDGPNHRYTVERDQRRDEWLERQGWTVMRVSNEAVLTDVHAVVARIEEMARRLPHS